MSIPTSPPDDAPRFFLDRNLGRRIVPEGLRAAGFTVVSLSERYGIPADETVTDVTWMQDAARNGEAALMCDDAIRRRNPVERRTLVELRLRAFVVNAQISGREVVDRFVNNWPAIERACGSPGPFVYRIHPDKITRLTLGA